MTALQVMKYHLKQGERLTYFKGLILPVQQVTDPKLIRLAVRQGEQENLAMVRRKRR